MALRQRALVGEAAVSRRLHRMVYGWPWRIFRMADHRLSKQQRAAVAEDFLSTRRCCLPYGLAGRLQEWAMTTHCHRARVEKLLGLQHPLRALGWLLKLSIGGCERMHSSNRARADAKLHFENFAAAALVRERDLMCRELGAPSAVAHAADVPAGGRLALPLGDDATAIALPLRKRIPIQMFKKDYVAEEKALGRKLSHCDADTHVEVRLLFDALEPDQRRRYEELAAASAPAARLARAKIQRGWALD